MKPDLTNNSDIEKVVRVFYEKVKNDKLIGHFFTGVINVNWDKHFEMMCSFWENVLFYTGDYEGDPLNVHRALHTKEATTNIHFEQWMKLFEETVNEFFEGANAEKMKTHAKSIATVMLSKI